MAWRFVAPPNWPQPEPGWYPPEGWQPPAEWGPPPAGWKLWQHVSGSDTSDALPQPSTAGPPAVSTEVSTSETRPAKVPLFGARSRVRGLSAEIASLKAHMDRVGVTDILRLEEQRAALSVALEREREAFDRQLEERKERMHAEGQAAAVELERKLGSLTKEVAALEGRRRDLAASLEAQQAKHAAKLERDLWDSRAKIESERQAAIHKLENTLTRLRADVEGLEVRKRELQASLVADEEAAMLQEVGVYQARHPLTDAAAYQTQLADLRSDIKRMTKSNGGAVWATTDWTVNGSASKGRVMVNETSKLMLRAYNAEADNLVRAMKPFKLAASIERLDRAAATIARLGKTMKIAIAPQYHRLRTKELELTADYLNKVALEKERERQDRERLREERRVQQEIEAERRRLHKEKQHYLNALAKLQAQGNADSIERLQSKVAEIDKSIEAVDYRAANVRAGYVYIISNVGSFGNNVIKIGMTRRLEPLERVRELGDASVPFRFDVHALFFSDDAVGIEHAMHERLAERRVNHVNQRREFFYATPAEAREHLLQLTGDLLHFEEVPEAVEYYQSNAKRTIPAVPAARTEADSTPKPQSTPL
jgi:uncharacterized protein DUF4041/Meiotically Up-regulated Gene 113 (MUG113) protein